MKGNPCRHRSTRIRTLRSARTSTDQGRCVLHAFHTDTKMDPIWDSFGLKAVVDVWDHSDQYVVLSSAAQRATAD
eukprot:s3090_g5.t1